jgi:hypothetical protein
LANERHRLKKILLIQALLFGLLGCAKSEVTVFHILPGRIPLKYAFMPVERNEDSSEYASYQDLVRDELSGRNFMESPFEEANVLVHFSYFTKKRYRVQKTTERRPKKEYGIHYKNTHYEDTYEVTRYELDPCPRIVGKFKLYIVDKSSIDTGKTKTLYRAEAESGVNSCRVPKVIPAIIKAIFKDFPGKSGSTRKLKLSAKSIFQRVEVSGLMLEKTIN